MISSLILVAGSNLKKADLNISLSNAKQIVVGSTPQFGWILHVAANTIADLGKAIQAFAKISGVIAVTTLAIQNPS